MSDINGKLSLFIMGVILTIYIISAIPELTDGFYHPDYDYVKVSVQVWTPSDIFNGYDVHLRYAMLKASDHIFGNTKVIPFVISITLVVAVYFFTIFISKNNISGIFAMSIFVANSLFRMFDTSPTYDNLWVLIFLCALYLSLKSNVLSVGVFTLAIFCKALTLLFIPTILLPLKKLRKITIPFLIVFAVIIGYSLSMYYEPFSTDGFVSGLFDWWWYLFTDPYLIVLVPSTMIIYLVLSIRKVPFAFDMFLGLMLTSFTGAIVEGFTIMNNEPYRYIPLIMYFSIAFGNLFGLKMSKVNIRKLLKSS